MAEDPDIDDEEGEDAPPRTKKLAGKTIVLFGALPAVLLLLVGLAGFLIFGGGGDTHEDPVTAEADGGHGKGAAAPGGPASEVVFYALPDILVNIRSDGGRPTYLKLKLTLEVDAVETVAQIEPAMPRVMDRFQSFLRELRVEDLSGSAGSYRLRLELLRRVNLAVAPVKVNAVLIEEMLIQ